MLAPVVPVDFSTRLRALLTNTLVHIRVAFRERVARIMTNSNNNIVAGTIDGNFIAKAWPKLLLSVPPGGFSMQGELSKRFGLWKEGNLLQLCVICWYEMCPFTVLSTHYVLPLCAVVCVCVDAICLGISEHIVSDIHCVPCLTL